MGTFSGRIVGVAILIFAFFLSPPSLDSFPCALTALLWRHVGGPSGTTFLPAFSS